MLVISQMLMDSPSTDVKSFTAIAQVIEGVGKFIAAYEEMSSRIAHLFNQQHLRTSGLCKI